MCWVSSRKPDCETVLKLKDPLGSHMNRCEGLNRDRGEIIQTDDLSELMERFLQLEKSVEGLEWGREKR